MAKWLIVTDLDGTLLEHETYSHAPAEATLDRLRAAGVPVAFASSKTAAEIVPLRAELGFAHVPAICENGGGLVPPGRDALPDRSRHARLRAALAALPAALRAPFRGFSDMDVDAVAAATGLPPDAAARARDRAFTEPGLWTGTQADRGAFIEALAAQGVTAREGGRFLTLGFGHTKAERMHQIADEMGCERLLALGDAPNDIEMLEAADRAAIVANPHRAPLPALGGEATGRILRTDLPGPAGWSLAVERILSEEGVAF
ncbi:MAG: HAD-IIB family hydrolase [Rhodosalinus sp.]